MPGRSVESLSGNSEIKHKTNVNLSCLYHKRDFMITMQKKVSKIPLKHFIIGGFS